MKERLRRNTPPLCAELPPGAQVYFLTYRRASVEGKVRFARVQNRNDTCVGVQSQLRWVQDRAPNLQFTTVKLCCSLSEVVGMFSCHKKNVKHVCRLYNFKSNLSSFYTL